ncbi:hypothetical protein [Sphingobium sp.]|uniref:hypothetical protein n=1 Tax=Sphingobium sp. TaxID=1912891 RepID=UPI0035C6944F
MPAYLHPFLDALAVLSKKSVGQDMADQQSGPDRASSARDDVGLMGSAPWRSILLWVSNDRAEPYFEIIGSNPRIC